MNQSHVTFRDAIRGSIVLVLGLLIVSYVVFQARFLLIGPQIRLHQEPALRQNQQVVTLTGSTDNISRMWLNGRPMFTNPQGEFITDVVLENGYTITTLEAEDRYGRRTTLTREFVYVPLSFAPN